MLNHILLDGLWGPSQLQKEKFYLWSCQNGHFCPIFTSKLARFSTQKSVVHCSKLPASMSKIPPLNIKATRMCRHSTQPVCSRKNYLFWMNAESKDKRQFSQPGQRHMLMTYRWCLYKEMRWKSDCSCCWTPACQRNVVCQSQCRRNLSASSVLSFPSSYLDAYHLCQQSSSLN